jgi:hypothetical protein
MPTSRTDVEDTLAVQDAAALEAILAAAEVSPRGATTPRDLAKRIADALWWNATTPIAYAAGRTHLEHIVDKVARRLGAADVTAQHVDPWRQIHALANHLVRDLGEHTHGVSLDDLDDRTRGKLDGSIWPTASAAAGATGSVGARVTSKAVLSILSSPIGRLLPLIPPLAPWVIPIKRGAAAIHLVSGPLSLALAVVTLDQSLGPDHRRLVPLLLGVGALGPVPPEEADVVEHPGSADEE